MMIGYWTMILPFFYLWDSVCHSIHTPAISGILTSTRIENETEVSFFNRELYEAFKTNPEVMLALNVIK